MDIIEKYEIYFAICGGSNAIESMGRAEVSGVFTKVEAMAVAGFTKEQVLGAFNSDKAETRGRKEKVVSNHMSKDVCDLTIGVIEGERAEQIESLIVGVCRSFAGAADQHKRGLNAKKLKRVLASSEITVKNIMGIIIVGERQARRYMKAAELVISLDGRNSSDNA